MARLYLVRHGKAEAGFGGGLDPGLDALGREQAELVAKRLQPLGPCAILTSPLRRARETALPLARAWAREAIVEEAVAEVPSPGGMSLEQRAAWLRDVMEGSWRDVDMALAAWRERAIETLAHQREDRVIFSHFVAINVAVGAAIGDDRVGVFSPDNCSVTILETADEGLRLIERGAEAPLTKVN